MPAPMSDPLPIAMAAVSVDGRCRERNPPDLAIFGPEHDRLVARFVDPAQGQALFARCVEEGTAEGTASLQSAAGPQVFRVSLWRQRGGDRIRILAAFAAAVPGGPAAAAVPLSPDHPSGPMPHAGGAGASLASVPAAAGDGPQLAAAGLAGPVEAIRGVAQRLRQSALRLGHAEVASGLSHILAASWRLRRLADELAGTDGAPRPGPAARRETEIDLAALLPRLVALAEPEAQALGADLDVHVPQEGVPLVVADDGRLWTLLDRLVRAVLFDLGGAAAAVTLRASSNGGCLVVIGPEAEATDESEAAVARAGQVRAGRGAGRVGDGPPADTGMSAELSAALLAACGATLERSAGGRGWVLGFAPERCLDRP